MFEIPDVAKLMRRRNNGAMKGILWFALGTAVGLGVSRMRNKTGTKQQTAEVDGPMEVDI